MIEMENERADLWIRERLNDEDADEDSEEYQQLAEEYSNLQEFLREQAEFEEELNWLRENGSSIIHKNFIEEINGLKSVLKSANVSNKPYMIYRMTYAHSVTLLEAFLGDTIKALVSESNDNFMRSMGIDELKKARYSLEFLALNNVDAKSLAIKELSKILYHNIPKVKKMFEVILNQDIPIDISKVVQITKTRHDIVHRNGMTHDGEAIILTDHDICEAIDFIEEFSNELQKSITNQASSNKDTHY
ncbi:hypothetical protein TUM17379_32050 [Shewanella algae]|uniref:RiboL-PSP-HEPN domain-containing protein n=2 Tax=Shewanella algae TaxID=38313 RepID=A0AAD1NQ43_9GAMM|nr:hypothetical protein TUM17379_32050 [Shewanella algae]